MPATLLPVGHLKTLLDGRAELPVPAGISIREALQRVGIAPELVALVVVNGEYQADKDALLREGDVVKLMAVIGGG